MNLKHFFQLIKTLIVILQMEFMNVKLQFGIGLELVTRILINLEKLLELWATWTFQ